MILMLVTSQVQTVQITRTWQRASPRCNN